MPFTTSEHHIWDNDRSSRPERTDDRAINERYIRGEGRIVIETNREKLPGFVTQLKDPDYMDLRPFYQRRPRWDTKKQSLLIESFIMNIPVPPVFLYEREYNSYEVMDGQQRITAIRDFYANSFKLKGLETWPELNGRTYATLPDKIRAGIDRRSITSIVLLKESTENEEEAFQLRETVFERLNTGGVKLERQEIRNALYRGSFNNMLHRITRLDLFRHIWGLDRWTRNEIETKPSLLDNSFYAKMGDAEVVLRFFALRHAEQYRRGMQGFLDLYMRRASKLPEEEVHELETLYVETLETAYAMYGEKVFRPYDPQTQSWESKPHRAFQDAVMVGVSEYLDVRTKLIEKSSIIIDATKELFEKHPEGTFTGRGNTKQDVLERIQLYKDMFHDILR